MKRDNAFTGLEAAIVLIAFVVVAAIFSYVLLGAGFFATQKAQEVTYAGIKQSVSNAVIDGSLYANATPDGQLNGFVFNVRIPLGGEAVNMGTTEFIYSSSRLNIPIVLFATPIKDQSNRESSANFKPNSAVTKTEIVGYYPTAGVELLTSGQFATYVLSIPSGEVIDSQGWFTLEMRPRVGAASLLSKTIGSGLISGDLL